MWRLVAIVVPLALDSFATAAAFAVAGLSRTERRRIAIAFPLAETVMPLLGLAVGRGIAAAIGHAATYVAAGALVVVGLAICLERDGEAIRTSRRLRGSAFLLVVLATSLDELALGLTIGLLHLSLVIALPLIAVQAVVASQLGLVLGARIGAELAGAAERIAGIALIAVGAVLLVIDT